MTLITHSGAPLERRARILLWSLLSVVLIGVISLGVRSLIWQAPMQQLFQGPSVTRLPVYGSVPDFALTDQTGRPVRRADLEGKVWVTSFIFTSCPDECPLMAAQMAQLQSDLAHAPELHLVSISVDPEHDIPAVLAHYAERFNADPARWLFLTGDKQAIYRLVRDGFRLGLVDPAEPSHPSPVKDSALSGSRQLVDQPPPRSLGEAAEWPKKLRRWLHSMVPAAAFADHGRAKDPLHSTRFVLIDRHAQIRGYYDSQEEAALQQLRQHLQILLREG
jgi:protein SCO1